MTAKELRNKGVDLAEQEQYEEALKYLHKAADLNDIAAINDIGVVEQRRGNYRDALEYYKIAAANDIATAFRNIGELYEKGLGVTKNIDTAITYYNKAIKMGCISAYYRLGSIYQYGLNGNKDFKRAMALYRKGAIACTKSENKDADVGCIIQYAYNLMDSKNCYLKKRLGYKYLKKGAKKNDGHVYYNLGCVTKNGIGTRVNLANAFECFKKAVHFGYKDAYYELALAYYLGKGTTKDINLAAYYLEQGTMIDDARCALLYAEICFSETEDPLIYTRDIGESTLIMFYEIIKKHPEAFDDDVKDTFNKMKNKYKGRIDFDRIEKCQMDYEKEEQNMPFKEHIKC